MVTDGGTVPAGWYPDPLGLPQLRWWDGSAWTEFTSAVEAAPSSEDDEAAAAAAAAHVIDDDVSDAPADDPIDDPIGDPIDDDVPAVGSAGPVADPADAVVPEPLTPALSDPFAAAEANALVFTTRRARRDYERKLALETGGPAAAGDQPYARLDTNPVDIQLTAGAAVAADAAPVPDAAADPAPSPATPQPADPAAPTAGTPLDGREDLLAYSALAPAAVPVSEDATVGGIAPGTAAPETAVPGSTAVADAAIEGDDGMRDDADGTAFSFASTEVADELPPARSLTPKRTYTTTAFILAALLPLATAALVALLRAPDLTATSELAWAICGGALLIGVLLAFLDASALRREGHERTASPLWALLTPIAYLAVRSAATRRETGRGLAALVALVVGIVLAAVLIYLVPDLLPLLVPGVTAPWSSPLG